MPLTRPIPDEAQPIVAIIRHGVPRPELPKLFSYGLGWQREIGKCCPLGLLSSATENTPCDAAQAGIYGHDDALKWFYFWHDEQRDPQALVDALWGPA